MNPTPHLVTHGRNIRFLLLALSCLTLSTARAGDCLGTLPDTVTYLLDQEAVDTFQDVYGPCDRVAGSLEIDPFNGPITSLAPLEGLVEIGQQLRLSGGFNDLTGLHNLVSVGQSLTIEGGSTPLSDLTGLSSLVSVGGLELVGLTSLTGLSGLTNLQSADYIRLTVVPALTDLNGLPAELAVQSLVIEDTIELASLNGLSALTGLENVQFSGNQKLADLGALANSTFVATPPYETSLTIANNLLLTNLNGVPVGEKFGAIDIESNLSLSSLSGLAGLVEVWAVLQVTDNPALSDCTTLATVLDANDDGDPGPGDGIDPNDPPDTLGQEYITLSGNLSGCNSIGQIVASVASQVIFMDSFETGSL